ncbi:FxSxx-COOH system tetratricopeptide repeat protein [Nonomuraea rubra]|uniref:FxSxx-COOH system tetratricopeptide repeat protein n=1 Tax=Nonomuraea rubra TaxID=46180 RepID=UPI0016201982|nr:FxSxx-COOH system tetratricopeptide repeat protein [Nonomuraea rubra]
MPKSGGGHVTNVEAAGPAPRVWGKIPPRNRNFTGREDLLRVLKDDAGKRVTAVLPQALHGIGGVGKTQVAIEYAYRCRGEYDLIWWVPADQPSLIPSSLAPLAPHLNLPSAKAVGIEEAAAAVLEALRLGEPFSRWLLIFDNADEPAEITPYIPPHSGHVLITSRNQRWKGVVDTLEVDVFSRTESMQFLNRRVPDSLSPQDTVRLAERLGDLPLALEQAGALQAETGMSAEEYLELLSEQPAAILGQVRASEYPATMTAAWQLSVSKLREQLPEAVLLLQACAFFGPEPIPLDVFRRGAAAAGPRLRDLLGHPILRTQAVRVLGRFALGRIDPVNRTIQIHRLVQALLQEELTAEDRKAFREEVHLLLGGAAPADASDESKWPRFNELVPHVIPTEVATTRVREVREFAVNMVRYLQRSGDPRSARRFVDLFLSNWIEDSGPDDPDVLMAQWQLAHLMRLAGEFKAAYDVNRDAIDRAQRVLGMEDANALAIFSSFGSDLRAAGEFAEARNHDEAALRLYQSAFGEQHARTLNILNNLALDHALNSDYRAARDLHQRTFMLQSESEGSNKSDVLSSWTNLARAVRLCGDYAEARFLGEDAYDFGRQELGAENRITIVAARDLSNAQRRSGAYDESLELAHEVFDRSKRLFGPHAPDTLAAAMSLANILRTVGREGEAYEIAADTMERYPKLYGETHPYNYGCLGNLALLRRVQGDAAGARDLNQQAFSGLVDKLGKNHHYSLTIAVNLATDLFVLGDHEGSVELGKDTYERCQQVLGEDHPMTVGCAANLSLSLRATEGGEDAADKLIEDALNRYARTLGMAHADTRAAKEGRQLDFDFDPPPL